MNNKYNYIVLTIILCAFLFGCAKVEDNGEKSNTNDDKNSVKYEFSFKYKELSDVSPFVYNSIIKYTDEYTSAPLYEWSEDVVLPIPAPLGAKHEKNVKMINELVFSGVTLEEWNNYVDLLKEKYIVLWEDKEQPSIRIYDKTYNFYVQLRWEEKMLQGDNISNYIALHCFMGNQEINELLDYDTVREVMCKKLDISEDDKREYIIYDVSTNTNIKDGYWIYYMVSSKSTYLGIFKGEELVGTLKNKAFNPLYITRIEFIESKENTNMYVLTNEDCLGYPNEITGFGKGLIEKYVIKDDGLEFVESKKVSEIDCCKDIEYITIKKNDDKIEIFEVVQNTNIVHSYNENWCLGKKLGIME
ncbi:MAG: hypothetical protein J6L69_10900 [Lachnospiraceae bacterium]|nr:hypothetical protein [Lachnospiraceae bacterium]